jgi:acetyltransferase-like isoleucine patch superfamily enzyme
MITIGDNVLLAGYDLILSHSFIMGGYEDEGFCPVTIKNGARIGLHCVILPALPYR